MMRSVSFGVALALLAACAPTGPEIDIPADTDFVQVSNGGSLFGSSSATIYAGDIAVFRSSGPDAGARTGLVTLRAGAFERLRHAALDLMAGVEETPVDEPACLDYGVDVIEVITGEDRASVSGACPNESLIAAQSDLRRLLSAEIVE